MKLEQLQKSLHEFLTNEEKLSASAKEASDSLRWIFKLNSKGWTNAQKELLSEAIRNYTVIKQHRDLKFWENVIPADINEENISAIFLDIRDKLGNPEKNKKYKELLIACFWISEHFAELLNLVQSILRDDIPLFKSKLPQECGVPFQFLPRQLLFANIWFKEFEGAALHFLNKLPDPDELELYKDSFIYIQNIHDLYYLKSNGEYEKATNVDPNLFEELNAIKKQDEIELHLSEKQIQEIVIKAQFKEEPASPAKKAVRSIMRKFERLTLHLNQIIKAGGISYQFENQELRDIFKKINERAVSNNLDNSLIFEELTNEQLQLEELTNEQLQLEELTNEQLVEDILQSEDYSENCNPDSDIYSVYSLSHDSISAYSDFDLGSLSSSEEIPLLEKNISNDYMEIPGDHTEHSSSENRSTRSKEKPSKEKPSLSQEQLAKNAIDELRDKISSPDFNCTAYGGFFAGRKIKLFQGETELKEIRPPARVKEIIKEVYIPKGSTPPPKSYDHYSQKIGRVLQWAIEAEFNKPRFGKRSDATTTFYKTMFTTLNVDVSQSLEKIKKYIESKDKAHWRTWLQERPTTVNKIWNILNDSTKTEEDRLKLAIYTADQASMTNGDPFNLRSKNTEQFYQGMISLVVLKEPAVEKKVQEEPQLNSLLPSS